MAPGGPSWIGRSVTSEATEESASARTDIGGASGLASPMTGENGRLPRRIAAASAGHGIVSRVDVDSCSVTPSTAAAADRSTSSSHVLSTAASMSRRTASPSTIAAASDATGQRPS
jgi:hypothetical protein